MNGGWRVVAWSLGGAGLSAGALLACILADPPPLQQLPPPAQPIIIGSTASPPLDVALETPPADVASLHFVVNVQVDPDQTLLYRVYRDYPSNPILNKSVDATGTDGGGVPVSFDVGIGDLDDLTQCHKIELDVATGWVDTSTNVPKYPPGGDRAVWNYWPAGNCNAFDAGPVPPQSDAGDAGDGGDE